MVREVTACDPLLQKIIRFHHTHTDQQYVPINDWKLSINVDPSLSEVEHLVELLKLQTKVLKNLFWVAANQPYERLNYQLCLVSK